ncbi:hypothetical protein FACS189472_18680 [Alphaproteobacteria bacterium]|nr:hypothetical protein FACS189472_18680 [Alphaproteobacteria bacterium]
MLDKTDKNVSIRRQCELNEAMKGLIGWSMDRRGVESMEI